MKKITLLLMAFMFWTFGQAQDAIITGYVDSPCSGADGRTVEIYVNGTVDFTGWNLVRQSNGGGFSFNIDLSSLGSLTDEFAYVTNDEATLDAEFLINSTDDIVIENGGISSNGDDAFQLTDDADVVIDRFGEDGVDGSGTDWEHADSYYYRNNGATANAGVFDAVNWTIGAVDALDDQGICNGEAALSTIVPFGSYTPNLATPGETCDDPIAITSLPYTTSDDTANYGDDYENSDNPCGNYLNGDDVVYAYTPASDMAVNITMSNIGSNWSGIHVLDGCIGDSPSCVASETSSGTNDRLIEELSLTGGTTYYIYISTWASPQSTTYDLDIEEVACLGVSDVVVDNITTTSADISWTENASATEWEILYGEVDFDPLTEGTSVADNNALGETLSGLVAATEYDVYVRANCGSGDLSDWTGPVSFTTNCEAFVPEYTEDFESFLPVCWKEAGSGLPSDGPSDVGSSLWFSDEFLNTGANNAAAINLYTMDREEWLISPSFDLSGDSYELAYKTAVTKYFNSTASDMGSDDEVQLLISEDNGTTWSNLITYDASNTPSATGQEEIVDLSAYSGTVKFAFWATDGAVDDTEDYDFFIDDFKVRTPPTCLDPSDLVVDNITSTTADISWTLGDSETEWEILYGEAGFDPASDGTSISDDDALGETLSGLTANTSYDVYVRAVCGTGDFSEWIGPESFTTECSTFTAPYTEDFEASMDETPDCWNNTGSNSKIWSFGTEPTFGNNFEDHTSGSGYLAFVDASTIVTTTDATLETPFIDVSSLTVPMLRFYQYHFSSGGDSNKITVEVWDGAAWNEVYVDDNGDVNAWEKIEVNLDNLSITGPIKARFVVDIEIGSNYENDIALDDVSIIEAPTCIAPSDLTISSVMDTSVDISWTAGDAETEWEILYGIAGFDPLAGGISVTDNDAIGETLSGLTPGTSYDVYVRAICASGDESDWIQESFTTACASDNIAYTEDFDTDLNLPNCWSVTNLGDTNTWEVSDDITGGAHSGDNAMSISFSSTAHNDYLITPPTEIVVGTNDLFSFWIKSRSTSYLEPYEVLLSTTSKDIASFDVVLQAEEEAANAWTEKEFDLSAYDGQVVYIAVRATGTNEFTLYADDFSFGANVITCPAPTDIVVSDITDTTADISWTESGSATEWEILYGEAGFDPLTEGASVSDTDALGEVLSGLTPDTSYDVYVRAICDVDVESDWAGPETFTTTTTGGGDTQDCGQTQVSNAFENGVFMEEAGTQVLANDFILSPSTANFSVDNITVNILSQGGIDTIDITFYEDNDGVPGTEIQTIEDVVPTSQSIIGNAFSFDVHEVVLDLTTPVDLAGVDNVNGTTYWLQLSGVPTTAGTQLAWETTTANPIGYNMVFDNENTTEWTEDPTDDGVFSITGECTLIDVDCFTPENLMVTNLTENSVDIEWTTVGDETEWTVEYGPTGFTMGSGTTEVVNGTPSTTISGLESRTEYDFYVIANCADGDSSEAGPVSATTLDAYCPIDFSNVEPITFVELADISNSSSEDTDSPAHEFFLDIVGNVEQGETYTVTVEGFTGGDFNTAVSLFADWDQNGSMDDAGERYDLGTIENSSGVDGVQLVADITVPAGATLGETRMRVVKRYSSTGTFPENSCDAGSIFGQAEDYMLNVSEMAPETCPAPTEVTISNIEDFSADVSWTENGTAVEWEILYGEAGFDPLTEGTSVIDADADPSYSITGLDADTDYEVYVRAICDVNDESDWAGPEPFTTTNLSVDSVNFEGFSYYPNPVKDQLFVEASKTIKQIEVYNLLGQIVISEKINQLDTELNLANLASGSYLMKVKINNAVKTFKLIKE